jgi:acyl carrier protein
MHTEPTAQLPDIEAFTRWALDVIRPPEAGHQPIETPRATDNLFELGLIDSFTMMVLLGAVEERFAIEIDVLVIDPEEFFTLGGIYEYVAQHA